MGPQLPALSALQGGEGEGEVGSVRAAAPGVSRQALAACSSSGSSRSATGVACQPSARLDQ